MMLARRRFLHLTGAAVALPVTARTVLAQVPQGGPKLTQILKADLQGQAQKVEETVVNILELAPGVGESWKGLRRTSRPPIGAASDARSKKPPPSASP